MVESEGKCIKCGKHGLLGDGLCVKCFDKANGVSTQRVLIGFSKNGSKLYHVKCNICGNKVKRRQSEIKELNYCSTCNNKYIISRLIGKKSTATEICPRCNGTRTRHYHIPRNIYYCNDCKKAFTPKAYLIRIPLDRRGVRIICKFCGGNTVHRNGHRNHQQQYICKSCNKSWRS